ETANRPLWGFLALREDPHTVARRGAIGPLRATATAAAEVPLRGNDRNGHVQLGNHDPPPRGKARATGQAPLGRNGAAKGVRSILRPAVCVLAGKKAGGCEVEAD